MSAGQALRLCSWIMRTVRFLAFSPAPELWWRITRGTMAGACARESRAWSPDDDLQVVAGPAIAGWQQRAHAGLIQAAMEAHPLSLPAARHVSEGRGIQARGRPDGGVGSGDADIESARTVEPQGPVSGRRPAGIADQEQHAPQPYRVGFSERAVRRARQRASYQDAGAAWLSVRPPA